jgi:hypothetical protein
MPAGYVAAIATVVGAGISYSGTKKASEAGQQSAAEARSLQERQYAQTREDYAPWLKAGGEAVTRLGELQGMTAEDRGAELAKTPGYQFRLDQGLKALQRTAAAGSVTGNTYRDLVKYGQEYGSAEYDKYYNRLASMAGLGQTAVGQVGKLGAQSATQQGGYAQRAGDIRASAYLGQSNIIGSTVGQLSSMYNRSQAPASTGNIASQNYYGGGYVAPGGSFGGGSQGYEGAGGYGDNWTDY